MGLKRIIRKVAKFIVFEQPKEKVIVNVAQINTSLSQEVAEVACFLLSDASRCISGEIIHTNAGNHIKTFWDK